MLNILINPSNERKIVDCQKTGVRNLMGRKA